MDRIDPIDAVIFGRANDQGSLGFIVWHCPLLFSSLLRHLCRMGFFDVYFSASARSTPDEGNGLDDGRVQIMLCYAMNAM